MHREKREGQAQQWKGAGSVRTDKREKEDKGGMQDLEREPDERTQAVASLLVLTKDTFGHMNAPDSTL